MLLPTEIVLTMISRPGQSQVLLYKQLCLIIESLNIHAGNYSEMQEGTQEGGGGLESKNFPLTLLKEVGFKLGNLPRTLIFLLK